MNFLRKSPGKVQEKFKFLAYRLLTEQQMLREPHVKHFSVGKYKAIYELRIKQESKLVRIMFSMYRGQHILLLHAFYKHSQQDGERGLETAYKRYCRLGTAGYAEPVSFAMLGGGIR